MSTWRDTMILVGGPLPPAIASEFERAWRGAHHGREERSPEPGGPELPGAAWNYALSGPMVRPHHDLRDAIPTEIAQAERSVALTTPYLIPDRSLWRAMILAVERGAKVRVLMPARSDHQIVDVVGHRFAHALVRRSVELRGYTRGMLHAKVAMVDGRWSSVSSFNLDLFSSNVNLFSSNVNLRIGVLTSSLELHDALAAQMETDWTYSRPL